MYLHDNTMRLLASSSRSLLRVLLHFAQDLSLTCSVYCYLWHAIPRTGSVPVASNKLTNVAKILVPRVI